MSSLFILTFNCAKTPPISEDFYNAIESKLPENISDLYVFGFQEISSILESTSNTTIKKLLQTLSEGLISILNEKYDNLNFKNVPVVNIGAIGLIIITPFYDKINQIYNSIGYPVGHLYTTLKGGIGIRIQFDNIEFTFVCMHLNAGENLSHILRRNSDLFDIINNLSFEDGWSVLKPNSHCFIFGDLNYRATNAHRLVDCDEGDGDNELLRSDELSLLRKDSTILKGFDEANIDFKPTYKRVPGSGSFKSNRIPSYCDRILYLEHSDEFNNNKSKYKVIEYDSIEECKISDHIPVYLKVEIPNSTPDINLNNLSIQNRLLLKKNSRIIVISNITTWLMGTGIYLTMTNQGRVLGITITILLYSLYKVFV